MRKVIILMSFLFLLTGCAVKYNLVINEDLTILEEAKMTGTTAFFDNYYKTTKTNVLKTFIEIYQEILDDNKYSYEIIKDQVPYVLATKKYDTVEDYTKKSILFNNYFDEVKYTEDGNIKRIETVGFNDNEPDNSDRFNVSELQISIKCPYKVTDHTAVSVDSNTNTYYYTLNKDNNKIVFEYDSSVKFNPNKSIIPTILFCIGAIIVVWLIVVPLDKNSKKKETYSK